MEKYISIFGSYEASPDSEEYKAAYDIGFKLAKLGFTIKNGGGSGIMEASTLGALKAQGNSIGIIIDRLYSDEIISHNQSIIKCFDIFERLKHLIIDSNGFIIFSGSTGTLAELALSWELINKGFIKKVPVICYGDYWKPLADIIKNGGFDIAGKASFLLEFTRDIDKIISLFK
jgi:uncharacterized protein (TIGR00725 family)